ncbi:MAG: S-layer homology domain-containing protein, partial [Clostridia bacterium]|nr:S-layer homology domain-containing protein [Clostridia bacterium]
GGGTISLPSTAPSTAPSVDTAPQITPQNPSANTYSDMNGQFALEAVKSLSSKNIISGYPDGSFKPDNQVTRAEFAKMAAVAFGIEKTDATSFADVSSTDWFAGYVGALSAKEVLKGYDGKFNPNAPITRQDAACVIYRLMSTLLTSTSSSAFADASDISAYAKDAVASLRAAGIVNGSENKFLPLSNITRGEAAVMFSNAINIQK